MFGGRAWLLVWPWAALCACSGSGDDDGGPGPDPGGLHALVKVAGDGQLVTPGALAAEPLQVRAEDAAGNPLAGISITWQADAGSGTVDQEESVTDEDGLASARWTVGADGRTWRLRAATGGLEAAFEAVRLHPANPEVNATASYFLQEEGPHVRRSTLSQMHPAQGFARALAYHDFDGDDQVDVLLAPLATGGPDDGALVLWNAGLGLFEAGMTLVDAAPTSPRKVLLGDYDADGATDALLLGTGPDEAPYPGEAPILLSGTGDRDGGGFVARALTGLAGYRHAGASADADGDGDLDLFLTGAVPQLLLNDGSGVFTEEPGILPDGWTGAMFTAEWADVDLDGYPDLIAAGHQQDGFPAQILWGGPDGRYLVDRRTELPALAGHGVVVDIDLGDLDGDGQLDLVLTRTGSEDLYQGYGVQVLLASGERAYAAGWDVRAADAEWVDWLRLLDLDEDGDLDLLADDAGRRLRWFNDGTGSAFADAPSYPANPELNATASHTLQDTSLHVARSALVGHRGGFLHAFAYHDFDGDEDTDVLIAPGDGSSTGQSPQLMINDGAGGFTPGPLLTDVSMVHGRKAILGDYDGDGAMDVFLAGHGYDAPPFPGEPPVLLLGDGAGGFSPGQSFEKLVGFFHAVASADVDGDGDLDVFLSGFPPVLLINDGQGQFTVSSTALPESWGGGMFTAELLDIDGDGHADLLVSGHEQDGFPTQILWGGPDGEFSLDRRLILPGMADHGVVIDLDVGDLDGDGRLDLVLNRTGSTDFYQGHAVQVFEGRADRQFEAGWQLVNPSGDWFDWLRLRDLDGDGDVDLLVDDASRDLAWLNDGQATFSPAP